MEMLSHFRDYCEHVASWWRLHHSAWLFAIILALCVGAVVIARTYGVSRRRWLLWVGIVTCVALFTTVMATFIMYYTEVLQHPLWFLVIAFTLFATLVSNLKSRPRKGLTERNSA